MSEEHRPYTAFTAGSLGFNQWTRMPFGLMNAPATYQRMMEDMLGELNQVCVLYLDEIVVFFLGHIISEDGVEADPEKVERVVNCSSISVYTLPPIGSGISLNTIMHY